jgi:monoamine oxidase
MAGRHETDVVVIGAGIAGLTAALRLREAGRSVVVLEARDRVGGRIHGFTIGARVIQLGGRWTGPGQDRIKALAAELGVAVKPFEIYGDAAAARGGDLPGFVEAVRRIDRLAETVPLDRPWTAPDAGMLDGQTLASWLQTECGSDLSDALGEVLMGFLPHPGDISLLHALFYLRSNGGFAGILGYDGAAHDSEIFDGGAHALTDRLAARLGDAVRLTTPVWKVRHDEDGVEAVAENVSVRAGHAVVTLPPVLAGRLIWEPALPPDRDYLTQRMPIRGKITAVALYDEPFWRAEKASAGFGSEKMIAWDEGGDERPASITMLVAIARSRELWARDEADREGALLDDLADVLGPKARSPAAVHMVYWAAEPWSRGCNSFLTTGAWTAYGHALRAPVGRILWAGAEMSERFVGQMEGAVRTAEAAAARILDKAS